MKWLANKTFPHPVLSVEGPGADRDYVGREFQMTPHLQIEKDESVKLDLHFALSEQSILALISQNKARFAVEVHCPKTYVRRLVMSADSDIVKHFQKGELHERVEISPYVVCTDKVRGHTSKNLHPEFGQNAKFDFEPGDVLAIAHPYAVHVLPEFAKSVGSVFELQPNPMQTKGTFGIGWDNPKVQLLMHESDARKFNACVGNRAMQNPLLASVYLISVVETLRVMSANDHYAECKWHQVISHKLHEQDIELKPKSDFLALAQKLLGHPVGQLIDHNAE